MNPRTPDSPLHTEIPDFLRPEFCALLAQEVRRLRDHWTVYDSVQTLGGSMYLHPWSLYSHLRDSTPRSIPWGLARHTLEIHFNASTPEEFCPPGFHVFDSAYSGKPGQVHIDSHSRKHPLFWESRATHRPLTFTIPIELPASPGGLDFVSPLGEITSHLPYKVGTMYLHDGQTPHAIAPQTIEPDELRLTLQGFVWRRREGVRASHTTVSNLIFF